MEGIKLIRHHLDWISDEQAIKLEEFINVFLEKNEMINLISRKDSEHIWTRHILHSLSIAKAIRFIDGMQVADVGTGGGLPGIPLAILFPAVQFTLIDSIGKKIKAVNSMIDHLELKNATGQNMRMEEVPNQFDFIVSRAVKSLPVLHGWLKGKIRKGKKAELPNGLLYIKGGDFQSELDEIGCKHRYWYLDDWFDDPFFETKKVVWINMAS